MNKGKITGYIAMAVLAIFSALGIIFKETGIFQDYVFAVIFGVSFVVIGSFFLPWPGPLQEQDRAISWRRCVGTLVAVALIYLLATADNWIAFAESIVGAVIIGYLIGAISWQDVKEIVTKGIETMGKRGSYETPPTPGSEYSGDEKNS